MRRRDFITALPAAAMITLASAPADPPACDPGNSPMVLPEGYQPPAWLRPGADRAGEIAFLRDYYLPHLAHYTAQIRLYLAALEMGVI